MRLLVVAVAALVLPACVLSIHGFSASTWVVDEETFAIDPAGLAHVCCTTTNGQVVVQGQEGGEIVVRVRKRAGGSSDADAEEALRAIEILHKRVDGGVALGWRWRVERESGWRAAVSFEITQPRSLPVRVELHNGSVRVVGIAAPVTVKTHNGRVTLHDCRGKVAGVTHNGSIDAEVASAELDLRTHNGSVRLVLGGAGPVSGTVSTDNGSVHLGIAGTPSVRLVCSTDNGRVSCERPLGEVERGRNFLVADVGEAQGRLRVETDNGSIRIE